MEVLDTRLHNDCYGGHCVACSADARKARINPLAPRWNSNILLAAYVLLDDEILKHHEESDAYCAISKARNAVEMADAEFGPR